MPQIPPINDAYVDDIIKSIGPYNPALNKTQGVKLRELVKLLRDRYEQEISLSNVSTQEKLLLKADLINGTVPSSQLPSFVDDVLEYPDLASFPASGENSKIYIALDSNKTYRWSGSVYVLIASDLALGETAQTAYRGDRGKEAYEHSKITAGNPHNVTKDQIGLANVDNTSDQLKPISTATQTALNAKLTATLATDVETQITATITEDNKVISRLKLFTWWEWIKARAQTIAGAWTFSGDLRINGLTVGRGAGNQNSNAVLGTSALLANTTGTSNVAVGFGSMAANTTGIANTALGWGTLRFNALGSHNVTIGYATGWGTNGDSGTNIGLLDSSVIIGSRAAPNGSGQTNVIVIGFNARGRGSNTTTIGTSATTSTKLFGVLNIATCPEYENNTAALAAGLVIGDVYRSGEFLKIVF